MKHLLCFLCAAVLHTVAIAQCDKNFRITSSKTEYVDSLGTVQRTQDEKSTIEITGQDIKIVHGENDDTMTGKIKTVECSWKIPYKQGKFIIRTSLQDQSGDTKPASITLEGKDGKLTITLVADEMPNKRIRLNMDSFEER